MIEIRHKGCGGLVAYDTREFPMLGDTLTSAYFQRVNGTFPEPCSVFHEICPECGEIIIGPNYLERMFNE